MIIYESAVQRNSWRADGDLEPVVGGEGEERGAAGRQQVGPRRGHRKLTGHPPHAAHHVTTLPLLRVCDRTYTYNTRNY